MIVYESQFVKIEYFEYTKQVIQRWESFISSELFRDAIDRTVEFVRTHPVLSLVSDTQKQDVVRPEDAEYAASVMPTLYKYGLKVMAFVIPENVFTRLSLNKFANYNKDPNIEYFMTLSEANLWIEHRLKE